MTTSSIGPGTVLGGRYQLRELLSDHAGARFWRATDTVLVRSVAVHAVPSDDPRSEELLTASRVSATVSDAHILRVLDCDTDEGVTWVVNEWGSGISLDLMLQRGPLPPARAAWLAHEVADCIAAAHANDVAHGALSPEHVLVTEAGAVKLIGFVVASALHGERRPDPRYGDLDEREADVIDLAGVLYAALTGRWPGVTPSAVPPAPREGRRLLRPRQVRAGIPRTLDAICTRVLVREGSQHEMPIDTAHEVAAALADYVGDAAAAAPLDLPSLHAEPTITLQASTLAGLQATPDGAVPVHGIAPSTDPEAAEAAGSGPDTSRDTSLDTGPDTSRDTGSGADTAEAVDTDPERTALHTALAEDGGGRPSPPPPPFEDLPERPLFASTEPRRNLPAGWPPAASHDRTDGPVSLPGPLTGTGSGAIPPANGGYWPFADEAEALQATGEQRTGTEGRNWLRLAAVLAMCLAIAVAMVFAFRLGRDNGSTAAPNPQQSTGGPTAVSRQLQVVSATAFDPEGDGEENDGQAANVLDGKPATTWETSTYFGNPRLGGLKSGVGLLLDLGADRQVGSVRADIVGSPTSVQVYATPHGVNDPPSSLSGLDKVGGNDTAGNDTAGNDTVLRLAQGTRTRFLVVWLTRLPKAPGGYRGEIADLSVWS